MTASALEQFHSLPEIAEEIDPAQERLIVAAIDVVFGEVPVILCGSRATGTAGLLSDFDVLVVLPWRRIPFSIKRLRQLSFRLTGDLGVQVTVNPLPERRLRRHLNLFLWKVARESRVLSSPPGFELPPVRRPPLSDAVRFSYLMSALQALLGGVDGDSRRRVDAAHKALLMLAQLRLLEVGGYAINLEEALVALGAKGEELRTLREAPDCWAQACSRVLAELAAASSLGWTSAFRVNSRYALLAQLRGRRRFRAALSVHPIDRRLARSAALLAGALVDRTAAELKTILAIRESLPRSLRRETPPTWEGIRTLLEQEWPDAHPLIAQ